jgi:nitrate/TMAO reductase-like tetraheme cytochrome c subunit
MRYRLILLLAGASLAAKDSCLTCHSGLQGKLRQPAAIFGSSVHFQQGFTCADCHGGDPNSGDPTVAMSAAKGFIGAPLRTAIPKLCARCHSDPNFMRRYNPRERVDQCSEYLISVHGQRLRTGDTAVATCIDCHGVHDIRPVRDPLSPRLARIVMRAAPT